eukprot:COSAG06_NODE_15503_length_1066_cov_1.434333_1_plen_122_part_10
MCKPCNAQFTNGGAEESLEGRQLCALCRRPLPHSAIEQDAYVREHAEAGRAWAQDQMGGHYVLGDGVERCDRTAVFWYKQAAEQGFAQAQHMLSGFLERGEGVQEDRAQAVDLCRRAEAQGF